MEVPCQTMNKCHFYDVTTIGPMGSSLFYGNTHPITKPFNEPFNSGYFGQNAFSMLFGFLMFNCFYVLNQFRLHQLTHFFRVLATGSSFHVDIRIRWDFPDIPYLVLFPSFLVSIISIVFISIIIIFRYISLPK